MARFVSRPTASERLPSSLYDTVRLKVVLLGNPGTGKTSFRTLLYKHILNFSKNVAADSLSADFSFSHASTPTVAVDYSMLPVFVASHTPKPTVYTTSGSLLHSQLAPLSLGVPSRGPVDLLRVSVSVYDCSGDIGYARVRTETCASWDFCIIFLEPDGSGSQEWLREAMEYGPRGPASKIFFATAKADTQAVPTWSQVCSKAPSMEAWGLQRTPDERIIHAIDNTTGKGIPELWETIFSRSRQCGEKVSRDRFTDVQAEAHKETNAKAAASSQPEPSRGPADPEARAGARAGEVESLSIAELKAELRSRGVPQAQWGFERQEMERALQQARANQASSPASGGASPDASNARDRPQTQTSGGTGGNVNSSGGGAAPAVDTDRLMSTVRAEVEVWAQGRSFLDMLNSVNSAGAGTELFVSVSSSVDAVSKAYKRAVLRVHPDKQTPGNRHAVLRATETFKVLNNAYDEYRKEKDRASSSSTTAPSAAPSRSDSSKFAAGAGPSKATFASRRR